MAYALPSDDQRREASETATNSIGCMGDKGCVWDSNVDAVIVRTDVESSAGGRDLSVTSTVVAESILGGGGVEPHGSTPHLMASRLSMMRSRAKRSNAAHRSPKMNGAW